MAKYLVDINLPRYFSVWNTPDYLFQADINNRWTDKQIWEYAGVHNLTIITKDCDFSDRILFSMPPPRVIHVRIGNLKMKEFHQIISKIWSEVCNLSANYKLVNVYRDRIEGIE